MHGYQSGIKFLDEYIHLGVFPRGVQLLHLQKSTHLMHESREEVWTPVRQLWYAIVTIYLLSEQMSNGFGNLAISGIGLRPFRQIV